MTTAIAPKPNQHYRLSLAKAIQDYKDGIITATGLVYYAVGIFRAPGQKFRVKDIEAFCKDLCIGISTFYKAISKLKLQGRLNWETVAGIDLWIPKSNVVDIQTGQEADAHQQPEGQQPEGQQPDSQGGEPDYQDGETNSTNRELSYPNVEIDSIDIDNDSIDRELPTLEPLPVKCSEQPSNISQSSYQIFINSLSSDARENFEKFCLRKVQELPYAPTLPEKWIKKNWEELRSQWEKSQGKVSAAQASKWENHPQKEEWLNKIRTMGYVSFWYENPDDTVEVQRRINFYDWAYAKKII
jgi:hypothetical protein